MSAGGVSRGAVHPGRRAGIASLLMVPAILVSFTAAELAGWLLQRALGLRENESLTAAGAPGVVGALLLVLLLLAPQVLGVVLGSRARRVGARRLGTAGLVLNVAIGAFMLLATTVNLLFL